MKITEIQLEYSQPTFPGGMSVEDMTQILKDITWEDGDEVAQAAVRCNNRCNGNDTTVEVPVLEVETGIN